MGKRRVVRRPESKKLTPEEQAIQAQKRQERAKKALGKARASIKTPTAQPKQSNNPSGTVRQAEEKPIAATKTKTQTKRIEKVTQGNIPAKYEQDTTQKGNPNRTIETKPKLRKKEKFEDRNKRMTTYVLKEHHQKLNELKTDYHIPITETINKALQEYFTKYNL